MARILVVEDDEQVIEIYSTWLTDAGYEVERVSTAAAACEHYLQIVSGGGQIDVVVMDLLLQGTNGAVAVLALRGAGYRGPVVVVTGGLMPINEMVVDRANFSERLLKPITDSKFFIDAIERHLRSSDSKGER